MLGLLREVRNFALFKIHGYVVQRSLNENMIFVLYCFRKSYQLIQGYIYIYIYKKKKYNKMRVSVKVIPPSCVVIPTELYKSLV